MEDKKNVLGSALKSCRLMSKTGFLAMAIAVQMKEILVCMLFVLK